MNVLQEVVAEEEYLASIINRHILPEPQRAVAMITAAIALTRVNTKYSMIKYDKKREIYLLDPEGLPSPMKRSLREPPGKNSESAFFVCQIKS
jgi:hypothetical protein